MVTEVTDAGSAAIPSSQALRVLSLYRLVLSGLLTVLYVTLADADPFGVRQPALFATTLLVYLGFSLVAGFMVRLRWPAYRLQAPLQVFVDIGAISLLMHASGGVGSGLAVLLVVAVAAGALLLPGRLGFLFASVATLVVLAESGLDWLALATSGAGNVTRAGLLGAVLFAAAGLAHILATRIRESEALARQRGIDLANLEQLNRHIIQHLQSGVLIVDAGGAIRLSNATARKLLGIADGKRRPLARAAPALHRQLQRWQRDPGWQPDPVEAGDGHIRLIPRFTPLRTAQGPGAMILLDDSATLARQSQQIKLASLGRLTASIAHEIRNPLGAISHAAQLLAESDKLGADDQRLTEIIGHHTRRVNDIIENVLQLSRRGPVSGRTLALGPWLADFVREFADTEHVDAARLRLDVSPDTLSVRADPGHLHQVLWNLCQNGIRHAGGAAELRLVARATDTGAVHLDVIDNGPGIAEETAAQIFEPFYTTAANGTGLGLYIARELCELNGCRLSYRPAQDSGSCFRLHFAPA